jgi:hypothetical protein
MAPGLQRYFVTSQFDDVSGILSTYGELPDKPPSWFLGFVHGLTTTTGMVAIITAAVGGILGSVVAILIGAPPNVALGVGLGSFTALFLVGIGIGYRSFSGLGARLRSEFPMPPSDAAGSGDRTPGA